MGPDDVSQGFETGSQGDGTGINPSWNDILSYVPEDKHSEVIPKLKEWDSNFQQVQSKYKGFDPYVSAGVTPDEVDFALGLANAISTQPAEVKKALDEWLAMEEGGSVEEITTTPPQGQNPLGGGQGQGEVSSQFDITQHPEFQQLREGFNAMAEILQAQREREIQEQEDAELESELESLKETHGEFDETYVMAQMLNGVEPEEAVKAYQDFVNKVKTESRRPPTPKTIGAGGAIPNQQVDPSKLNPQETRNLAAQMLKQALSQQ